MKRNSQRESAYVSSFLSVPLLQVWRQLARGPRDTGLQGVWGVRHEQTMSRVQRSLRQQVDSQPSCCELSSGCVCQRHAADSLPLSSCCCCYAREQSHENQKAAWDGTCSCSESSGSSASAPATVSSHQPSSCCFPAPSSQETRPFQRLHKSSKILSVS